MVAPIRDFGTKFLSTLATYTLAFSITLSGNMNIVVDSIDDLFKDNCDNFDEVRDHSMTSNMQSPKTLSMSSSECNKEYLARV